MIIRVSERGTFKRCRQRWDYSSPNRQGLAPRTSPTALLFGTMMHRALELWTLDDDRPEQPQDYVTSAAYESYNEMRERYHAIVGAYPSDEELEGFYESVELGLDVIENYAAHWQDPIPDGFDLVKSEQSMLVPIEHTGHYLQGTLDGLLRSKDSGELFILERKTYANRPRLDVLANNDQFLAYMWMVQQVFGETVGGIVYDGMWKRKLEKKRTLDDLFLRTVLVRPQHEVGMFERRLYGEIMDMTNDPYIYLNRRWEGCHDCPFDALCVAESKGEDVKYVRDTQYIAMPEELESDNDWST